MFVGRRPGTAPVRFRSLPQRGSPARQRLDRHMAGGLFVAMVLLCLLCWGPIPLACLWVGAHVNYLTGSVSLGILLAFATLATLLFGTLRIMRELDHAWLLVRRAAGYDQRSGALARIFAATAGICAAAFTIWFVLIHGPGSSVMPGGSGM